MHRNEGFAVGRRDPAWLDEVLRALAADRVSIVGVSLGGWLALDYAARRPERVERIAVLSPGGVGRLSDDALMRLTMPVLAIVGARDVLLDSRGTRLRLEACAPHAEVVYLPDAGHFIPGKPQASSLS